MNEVLEKLNRFTRREHKAEEVYLFDVILCDNDIDRDMERFSEEALAQLQKLFIGKTGIFDHDAKSSGQTARIFDTELVQDTQKKTADGRAYVCLKAHAYMVRTAANADLIAPAHCVADILANKAAGKMSGVLTVEDGVALDGKIERVDEFYQKGVRMIGLTWNYENCIGYPCKDDAAEHMLGLKPFGIEAVQRMNELGIMIDTSHLSEGGFWDVVKHSSKPFMASHSCARALRNHRRNLTDEQLRALAEKGGICGVNFYSAFLHTDGDLTKIDDIVRHMVYIADKAGIETVAMGSDFDGIDCELEMKDFSGFPALIEKMQKYFTDDEIDLITHKNFLRIL
jgi:membrane dipeptidase